MSCLKLPTRRQPAVRIAVRAPGGQLLGLSEFAYWVSASGAVKVVVSVPLMNTR